MTEPIMKTEKVKVGGKEVVEQKETTINYYDELC
jgi:hypothetical protein